MAVGQLVAVYFSANARSRVIGNALHAGIKRAGDRVRFIPENQYRGDGSEPEIAAFYGFNGRLRQAYDDYRQAGRKLVFVDMGYFQRRINDRYDGYHKVAVGDRHPTEYFQNVKHGRNRRQLGISLKPRKKTGEAVLLAGMGDKAAAAIGLMPGQWELAMIDQIRAVTSRPIIYRPKPSWAGGTPLPGAGFSPRSESLDEALAKAAVVVTHHSNVGVDAIVEGIPVLTVEGVALPLGLRSLDEIENPGFPDDHAREQWLNDVHYCQWSVDEIARGVMWKHLRKEGLV